MLIIGQIRAVLCDSFMRYLDGYTSRIHVPDNGLVCEIFSLITCMLLGIAATAAILVVLSKLSFLSSCRLCVCGGGL